MSVLYLYTEQGDSKGISETQTALRFRKPGLRRRSKALRRSAVSMIAIVHLVVIIITTGFSLNSAIAARDIGLIAGLLVLLVGSFRVSYCPTFSGDIK